MEVHAVESTGFGIFGCIFGLIALVIGAAVFAFWLWMLIDCATKCPSADNKKLIWILVIIFTHVVGAIIYYFVQRPKNPTAETPPSGPPQAT